MDILIQSSWQILILALVVWPLSRLSLRSYPNFAYLLWVVILVKALIPVNISLPTQQVPVIEISPVITGEFIHTVTADSGVSFSITSAAILLWLIGVTFLAVKLLFAELSHRNRMKQAVHLSNEPWFEALREEMGVRQTISLYCDDRIHSPLMQGLWRPRIYLPAEFQSWDLDEKRSILAHELAHIKRSDIIIIYLQALVKTLYFFHPVIWLVNDQIDLEREKICDDEAINIARTERGQYGEQLFRQLSQENEGKSIPVLAGGFFMSDSSLIKRFRYIKEKRRTMTNKLRPYHVMLVLLVVSLAVLIACSTEQDQTLMDPSGLTKLSSEPGFEAYDSPPSPIGGMEAIQDNVIYPDLARQAGIGGTTIVQVTVNTSGEAVNPEVLRSSGNVSLDAAAMNAATVTSWTPAMKEGSPVRVKIALPVVFRLKVGGEGHSIHTANTTGKKDWDKPPIPEQWKKISENIVYPEVAKKAGISGTVTLEFTIDENGNLLDPEVVKGPDHPALKAAAVEALRSTAWFPAEKDGKPISARMEMGIGFEIEEERSSEIGQGIRPVDRLEKVPVKISGADAKDKAAKIYYEFYINEQGEFEAIRGSNTNSEEWVAVNHSVLDKWMHTKWVAVPEGAALKAQWVKIPLEFTFID